MAIRLLLPISGRAVSRATRAPPSRYQLRHSSISQRPNSTHLHFPGAVNSAFTPTLSFTHPSTLPSIPTFRILNQEGTPISPVPTLPTPELHSLYTSMVSVSILDSIMFDAQRQGKISFYMVSAGEEGIAVGSCSALSPRDPIFAQYREAGIFAHRGWKPKDFLAQLFATSSDTGKGRNMPVHYGDKALHIHTISSPLATQIPQASGAAYAVKLQNQANPTSEQRVVACYFGEGAASEGDFHAALNIAATRSCPVIFICRNNGYAISTPTLEQYRGDGIASRGVGYGIDTIRVDGNDILAVREATAAARKLALEDGGKPVLVEAMSYRVSHHSTSDDSFAYRAKVDVEEWRRRDNPITRLRKYMEARGVWDEDREKELRAMTRKEVLEAYREAEKAKHPALKHMMTDVYSTMTEEQIEQVAKMRGMLERYPDEYDVSSYERGAESLNDSDVVSPPSSSSSSS